MAAVPYSSSNYLLRPLNFIAIALCDRNIWEIRERMTARLPQSLAILLIVFVPIVQRFDIFLSFSHRFSIGSGYGTVLL